MCLGLKRIKKMVARYSQGKKHLYIKIKITLYKGKKLKHLGKVGRRARVTWATGLWGLSWVLKWKGKNFVSITTKI